MASYPLHLLTTLLSLLLLTPPSSSTLTTVTLTLSSSTVHHPSSSKLQTLTHLASLSLSRAHHLKSPNPKPIKTPLFSRSYGGYSVSLAFGTPPQPLTFVMDTGSSLVWFPCTSRYRCSDCNFRNINASNIRSFIPKRSSSTKLVGCKNAKCSLFFGAGVESRCHDCKDLDNIEGALTKSTKNCTQTCPPYMIQYGLGSTAGLLVLENLVFTNRIVPEILIGCSIVSTRQPEGIAGFGRGPVSLPSQMGLNKFSYCLIPRIFDEAPVSSDLVLYLKGSKTNQNGTVYTPFLKNPNKAIASFQEYYYVMLRKIIVGDKHVKIPYKFLVPGLDGHGGTIIDSGSTFTFMEMRVFELVAKEFEKQLVSRNYTIATDVENQTGLRPCFRVSGQGSSLFVPELVFQFKGGVKLKLPLENYLAFVDSGTLCLTVVSSGKVGLGSGGGPAVILGNFQQQNFYVEYDLENERFGFKRQSCV